MASDLPENLERFPRELDFISKVPADWAESHLIAGEVGDFAVFARKDRNSADWYVGGINDADPRTVEVKFDFLDKSKSYKATIYKDADDADYRTDTRHKIVYQTLSVRKGDVISVRMGPGGGFAMRVAAP